MLNLLKNNKKLKNIIRHLITIFYPFAFPLISFLAKIALKCTQFLYSVLFILDWQRLKKPEWFDHDQDTFYQFNKYGHFFYIERGIIPRLYASNYLINLKEFQTLKIEKKINILDFCSGDSYISQKFFFDLSDTVVSIDLDPKALARGENRLKNNKYMNKKHYFYQFDVEKMRISNFLKDKQLDIKFDIILFNAAIEHFKEEQLDFIFLSLKEVMKQKSFISIYTIVEDKDDKNGRKYLPDHHEMFFSGKKHLEQTVSKYFKFTKSHHSLVNDRCNIYCIASNEEIKI